MSLSEAEIMRQVVLPTIERAKVQIPYFACENPTDETPLYGVAHAVMDSLNLVTFIFLLEEQIQRAKNQSFTIDTQDILNQSDNPFANLKSLTRFLKIKFDEADQGH
jgi:hypothetical protein